MNRRSFLLGALATPAIVRYNSLMRLPKPRYVWTLAQWPKGFVAEGYAGQTREFYRLALASRHAHGTRARMELLAKRPIYGLPIDPNAPVEVSQHYYPAQIKRVKV